MGYWRNQKEIKKFLETNDNENTVEKLYNTAIQNSKSSSKREVYSNTILPQEIRKTLNRQPNFTPKTTGKWTKKHPKISRRKEIIKIWAKIKEK